MSSTVISKAAVSIATRGLPLDARVELKTDGVALGQLIRRGLSVQEVSVLADCTPQTVYNRIKSVYTPAQYQELLAVAFAANRSLHREALREVFFHHRNHPELAQHDSELIRAFGSPEEVQRQVRIAQRAGAINQALVRPVQNLLAAG